MRLLAPVSQGMTYVLRSYLECSSCILSSLLSCWIKLGSKGKSGRNKRDLRKGSLEKVANQEVNRHPKEEDIWPSRKGCEHQLQCMWLPACGYCHKVSSACFEYGHQGDKERNYSQSFWVLSTWVRTSLPSILTVLQLLVPQFSLIFNTVTIEEA